MKEQITALVVSHISTIKDELLSLKRHLDQRPPDVNFLAELTHKMKGSAGTVGFTDVSRSFQVLNDFYSNPTNECAEVPSWINDEVQKLDRLVADLKPEHSVLLAKLSETEI